MKVSEALSGKAILSEDAPINSMHTSSRTLKYNL